MLTFENVCKSFENGAATASRMVLNNVSFTLKPGLSAAIVGPSGVGKSTLLNLASALLKPDAGKICFEGKDIFSFSEHELNNYRNRSIGIVFQQHLLFPQLTLLDNVLLPVLAQQKITQVHRNRAIELIDLVGLSLVINNYPTTLSGGECQRAALARAVINNPKLILADEPTGALDEMNAGIVSNLLLEVQRTDGAALLVVTHNQQLAAKMSRQLVLSHGCIK